MPPEIHGHSHPDWAPVRDAFIRNMADERGAAVSIVADGQVVVDLWAGDAAPGRPWAEDTLCTAFSATKGLVALAFARLVEQGRVDLDAPVAAAWPDFAQAGKGDITVRELLEHRAGLVWVDEPMDLDTLGDLPALADILARQAPGLPRGTQGYGATAWGKYAAVLYWKLTGETVGTALQRDVAGPLGVDLHLGLPPEHGHRLATLVAPGIPDLLMRVLPSLVTGQGHDGRLYRAALSSSSPTSRAVANPPRLGRKHLPRLSDPQVLATELPWVGAAVTARGLARMYGALAAGGAIDGVRLLSEDTVADLARQVPLQRDAVIHKDVAWNRGFLKEQAGLFSPDQRGFGHPGAGGSVGWAMPDDKVGIGYVLNRLDPRLRPPRTQRICRAAWQVLGREFAGGGA